MVGDEIEEQLDAAGMQPCYEIIEHGKAAEQRIDIAIIRNVVAEIEHWQRENRAKPDCVDAEPFEIRDSINDALQISLAVAIRILKRHWSDLIDHRPLPPFAGTAG